jgi:mRNA-degrading endonuclease toxin of MazEF toxin-antitoxin module
MILDYILKLFDWCKVNATIINNHRQVLFKEGEIWWCHLGLNIGEEEFGKGVYFARPVLIFKKFTTNSFLGLPLTSSEKIGTWYVQIKIRGRESSVMLNQARIFDKKRLRERVVTMNEKDFMEVKERFQAFYCPKN